MHFPAVLRFEIVKNFIQTPDQIIDEATCHTELGESVAILTQLFYKNYSIKFLKPTKLYL